MLILRVRMPISDDLSPRNFVTKISKYERVVNIPNSMSVLYDLLPVSIEMTLHDCRGVFNFTNPGAISHNEILDLYKKYIDPSFTYTNFTLEEQAKILAAGRSNNELDSSKLVETCRQFGVEIPPIKESIVHVFERMQKNLGIELWGVCSESRLLPTNRDRTGPESVARTTSHSSLSPPLRRTCRRACTARQRSAGTPASPCLPRSPSPPSRRTAPR